MLKLIFNINIKINIKYIKNWINLFLIYKEYYMVKVLSTFEKYEIEIILRNIIRFVCNIKICIAIVVNWY